MAQHINQKANKGQGHTSIVSFQYGLRGVQPFNWQAILQNILDELKASKYLSVSVNSTPDISC
jgi:hypothetical protein